MNRAVLSILVSNHFGVLTRVTNLFSQRGFNIDSLAVGETENENYSRITITTSGDAASVNQIKHLHLSFTLFCHLSGSVYFLFKSLESIMKAKQSKSCHRY